MKNSSPAPEFPSDIQGISPIPKRGSEINGEKIVTPKTPRTNLQREVSRPTSVDSDLEPAPKVDARPEQIKPPVPPAPNINSQPTPQHTQSTMGWFLEKAKDIGYFLVAGDRWEKGLQEWREGNIGNALWNYGTAALQTVGLVVPVIGGLVAGGEALSLALQGNFGAAALTLGLAVGLCFLGPVVARGIGKGLTQGRSVCSSLGTKVSEELLSHAPKALQKLHHEVGTIIAHSFGTTTDAAREIGQKLAQTIGADFYKGLKKVAQERGKEGVLENAGNLAEDCTAKVFKDHILQQKEAVEALVKGLTEKLGEKGGDGFLQSLPQHLQVALKNNPKKAQKFFTEILQGTHSLGKEFDEKIITTFGEDLSKHAYKIFRESEQYAVVKGEIHSNLMQQVKRVDEEVLSKLDPKKFGGKSQTLLDEELEFLEREISEGIERGIARGFKEGCRELYRKALKELRSQKEDGRRSSAPMMPLAATKKKEEQGADDDGWVTPVSLHEQPHSQRAPTTFETARIVEVDDSPKEDGAVKVNASSEKSGDKANMFVRDTNLLGTFKDETNFDLEEFRAIDTSDPRVFAGNATSQPSRKVTTTTVQVSSSTPSDSPPVNKA